MQELMIDLSVGESLKIGPYTLTLLEVDGNEFLVKLDGDGGQDAELALNQLDSLVGQS